MVYLGEILAVQTFIKDMTGIELRTEVVREALVRAEKYRKNEEHHEAMGRDI